MPGTTIDLLLIEQDFSARINLDMTITSRAKADCWKIAQEREYISPQVNAQGKPAKATKPRVRAALEELVFVQRANFPSYTPGHGVAAALGGQSILDSVLAQAISARIDAGLDEDDDCACESGMHHIDDGCDC